MHLDKQRQIAYNFNKKVENVYIELELEDGVEYVPAPYYCTNGCGGNRTDESDINIYENGICVRQDVCECFGSPEGSIMWSGLSCEVAECAAGCHKGTCVTPENCVCLPGWTGVDCSQAICAR